MVTVFFLWSVLNVAIADSRFVLPTDQNFPGPQKTKIFSNHDSVLSRPGPAADSLTKFVPTHVIRTQGNIEDQKLTCEEVFARLNKTFINVLYDHDFYYLILANCGYDPQTELAVNFRIKMNFDPLSDEATRFLEEYVQERQNTELLGHVFKIEKAKAAFSTLHLMMGHKKDSYDPNFVMIRESKTFKIFKNDLDALKLDQDIRARFFTQNQVLPFIAQWFDDYTSAILYYALARSTYTEFQPFKVLYMETGEEVFVPLQIYFSNYCPTRFPNKYCL